MARGTFHSLGSFQPPGFPVREARLYLPEGHHADVSRPLLFAVDGQNAFGDVGSQPGWFLHDAIDSLPVDVAPAVVAVSNAGPSRADELTPWITDGWGGNAGRFLDWLERELVPAARLTIRAPEGAVGAAIVGASWGGLFALWAHFLRPHLFGGALAVSPSFWVGRGRAFEFFAHHPVPSISRLYMDCGSLEDGGQMLANASEIARMLRVRGYDEDRLRWVPVDGADHTEREWRKRLPSALAFMYRSV